MTAFDVVTVPMEAFALQWRFTDPRYAVLPSADLEQVKPLDAASARQLSDAASRWATLLPSAQAGFARVAKLSFGDGNADDVECVQRWLLERDVPRAQQVFASWSRTEAVVTTWEIVARYWSVFWYPSSDDLFVFDASLAWVLFLSHEEQAFFATA